jgi:hypothetical protein
MLLLGGLRGIYVPNGPFILTVFIGEAADRLFLGGGNMSKDTSDGRESGAFPILEQHLGDELNALLDCVEIERMGRWVLEFSNEFIALFKQRQRALGNMASQLGLLVMLR